MKLNYGKVARYNERGFGFVKPLLLGKNCEEVFFHISKVKHMEIEAELLGHQFSEHGNKEIFFWFTTEDTEKGIAVKECWLKPNNLSHEYLIDLAENIATYFSSNNIIKEQENLALSNLEPIKASKFGKLNYKNRRIQIRNDDSHLQIKYNLSSIEFEQIKRYISIYKENSFQEHYEVNQYITNNDLWDEFSKIRSLNDHGSHKGIPGILPKFYGVACKMLNISGADGAPLDKAEPY